MLFLDKKNHIMADELMGSGTVDHAPIYPREVIKRAPELSVSALILIHNHPSGDSTPSNADIDMTSKLYALASQLNIVVHDHLIIGRVDEMSCKNLDLLEPQAPNFWFGLLCAVPTIC